MAAKDFQLSLTIKAFDKATPRLREINAQIASFTSPFAKVVNAAKGFGTELGLPAVGKALGGVGSATQNVGREVFGLGAKIAAMSAGAAVGLYALVKSVADAGSALQDSADRAGLTVDAYAQLEFVASRAGLKQEEFAVATRSFARNLGMARANTGSLFSLLKTVSPTLLKQVKGAKDSGAAFDLMFRAMAKLKDPAKRAALANAAFGDSGVKLAIAAAHGTKEIEKQRAEFLRMAGPQAAFAKAASDMGDTLDDLGFAVRGLVASAGGALLPVLTDLGKRATAFIVANREGIAKWARDTAKAITAWVKGGGIDRLVNGFEKLAAQARELFDRVGGLKPVLLGVAAAMSSGVIVSTLSLVGTLGQLGLAVGGVVLRLGTLAFGGLIADLAAVIPMIVSGTGVMEAFNLVLAMNPIGAVVLAVAALAAGAYLIYKNWGPIKKFFGEVWDELVNGVKKAWDFVEPYLEKIGAFFLKFSGIGQALKVFQAAKGFFGGSDSAPPRPTLGADRAAPPAMVPGRGRVTIDIPNLPRGARVTTDKNSTQPVDLDLGYSPVSPL